MELRGHLPDVGEIKLLSSAEEWEPFILQDQNKEFSLLINTYVTIRPIEKFIKNKEKILLRILLKKVYAPLSMPPILPYIYIDSKDEGLNFIFNSFFKNFFENLENEDTWILFGYLKDFTRKVGVLIVYNKEKEEANYFLSESVFYPDSAIN